MPAIPDDVLRFLSAEWVAAFDDAVADVELPPPGDDAGLAAGEGDFAVAQRIEGGPDGDCTLLLTVRAGRMHLALVEESLPDAQVTIALSYEDAAALSRGELAVADALAEGRVRVRGDLSVLVEGQRSLAAARPHVRELAAATTY